MKGSYILIIKLEKDIKLKIGKNKNIEFKKGFYCYVGSANGNYLEIEDRIKRYFIINNVKNGNIRWHIDYLLINPSVKIVDVLKSKKDECKLAKEVENICIDYVENFGCSDCKCESHLFFHYVNPKRRLLEIIY